MWQRRGMCQVQPSRKGKGHREGQGESHCLSGQSHIMVMQHLSSFSINLCPQVLSALGTSFVSLSWIAEFRTYSGICVLFSPAWAENVFGNPQRTCLPKYGLRMFEGMPTMHLQLVPQWSLWSSPVADQIGIMLLTRRILRLVQQPNWMPLESRALPGRPGCWKAGNQKEEQITNLWALQEHRASKWWTKFKVLRQWWQCWVGFSTNQLRLQWNEVERAATGAERPNIDVGRQCDVAPHPQPKHRSLNAMEGTSPQSLSVCFWLQGTCESVNSNLKLYKSERTLSPVEEPAVLPSAWTAYKMGKLDRKHWPTTAPRCTRTCFHGLAFASRTGAGSASTSCENVQTSKLQVSLCCEIFGHPHRRDLLELPAPTCLQCPVWSGNISEYHPNPAGLEVRECQTWKRRRSTSCKKGMERHGTRTHFESTRSI